MLGYIWAYRFYTTMLFGKAYGEQMLAYMADLRCDGNESSLFDCSYAGWGSHRCEEGSYGEYRTYAIVVCDPSRIRLIGGSGPNEGRVEVRPEDSMNWGTVCHNRFNMDDADIVCRMLGYPNATQQESWKDPLAELHISRWLPDAPFSPRFFAVPSFPTV
ncbi:scavenger receptor [Branchiostoma belcheri]|nr:scavenger receptor [Branchiostoma belcheri]